MHASPHTDSDIQRLLVLIEIADVVTRELSLDHQLPRLIERAAAAFDAERATLFLYDPETGELFSRVAQGDGVVEIRVPASRGIAGWVFASGKTAIVADAYQDPRFYGEIDRHTGFFTRSILCGPLRNRLGKTIGVTEIINKRSGCFSERDASLLEAINRHVASALEQARIVERIERLRREEEELLAITQAISTELRLDRLLPRVVHAITELLDAECSTLFIYDPATDELWSKVADGTGETQIRVPAKAGAVGAAFTSGQPLDIPNADAHPLFSPEFDGRGGARTRTLLNVPVIDRSGQRLGIIQVINKRGGPFTKTDMRRLAALSAEIAIAIQNAQLYSDVLELKNYSENILKSLSNGVVTVDNRRNIVKANEAAHRILGVGQEALVGLSAEQVFGGRNPWVMKSLHRVSRINAADYHRDADLVLPDGTAAAVNLTTTPVAHVEGQAIGHMLVFEDITREKRVRNTMARYVANEIVDRLLTDDDPVVTGSSQVVTVLFADIRRFTTLLEAMGPREVVSLLNEYFSEMVEAVSARGGMLDKYIGDGLMAVFGAPIVTGTDADNALRVATDMIRALGRLNARWAAAGQPPIDIGIGLATGEVVAGSIGARKRMDYTVIGDSVNLAAWLESANKYYGTSILLGGATVADLGSPFVLRRLDLIRAKGMSHPTEIYESLAHHAPASFPNLAAVIAAYEAGLDRYLRHDFAAAERRFATALELAPADRPSRLLLNRCAYLRDHPPNDDWNGAWVVGQS